MQLSTACGACGRKRMRPAGSSPIPPPRSVPCGRAGGVSDFVCVDTSVPVKLMACEESSEAAHRLLIEIKDYMAITATGKASSR